MNQVEGNVAWERYARFIQESWETEHRRQTAAYQQLEIEMSKLLQLLHESQRNQNNFMIEAATLFEQSTNNYHELRKDVMSFIEESRRSQVSTDKMEYFQNRFDEMISKLESVIASLSLSSNQESQQLIRPSKSLPSPSLQIVHESASMRNIPNQQPSASFTRESGYLLQPSSSKNTSVVTPPFNQESNNFIS